ncbi:MAG TPA: vWA domain-containing protein [Polyangiaceae bacterium]|nr:vWA domain-containing protein [Polyangiaceae bacterium]
MPGSGSRRMLHLALGFAISALFAACVSSRERPEGTTTGADGGASGGTTSGFQGTAGGDVCGNEEHTALTTYPLLYFVFDRSGSMADLDGNETRYARVRDAALDMTDSLGALVRVGATVFPSLDATATDACLPGEEVYSPKIDPGPVFASSIDVEPGGGTPTAATLRDLLPKLSSAADPKVVILATDGAPNCDADTTCGSDTCMVNVLGECPSDAGNCCEPPAGTWENCIDRLPTLQAILDLKEAGVNVYVIGIPGSELFETVLDQMALAGGVPQSGQSTYYYRVDDLGTLGDVFKGIASALVSCKFDLEDPPSDPGLTNVYFDNQVVVQDPSDGWVWVDGDTIELVGEACDTLKSGAVKNVRFVSGCPTVMPE